jgi:hypothetical protein
LTIAQANPAFADMSDPAIKYGEKATVAGKLAAGAVIPAGATVNYQEW